MRRRLRFVFEDPDQPELRDDVPVPKTHPGDESHRAAWGAFWRQQCAQPFRMDAAALRLVVEGEEGEEPNES